MATDLHADERKTFDRLVAAGDVGPILQPLPEIRPFEINGRSYLEIGGDLGTTIAFDPTDRSVVSVESESGARRLVSSSMGAFPESLLAARNFWANHADDSDADYESAARNLRERIAGIDAAALGSDDTWWSIVLEQVEDGLL